MFVPEYTITSRILRNIGNIEYCKAVIENTPILKNWESQLQKDASIDRVFACLQMEKVNMSYDNVKKYVEGLTETPIPQIKNLLEAFNLILEISRNRDFDEMDVRYIAKTLTNGIVPKVKQGAYRSVNLKNKTAPQAILASMVEFLDWHTTLDVKEEHPVIIAAVSRAYLTNTAPFELYNDWAASLISYLILLSAGYGVNSYLNIEDYIYKTLSEHNSINSPTEGTDYDYTKYIEYYTEQFSDNLSDLAKKIKLLSKDTKLAKATGRIRLTERQQRIVEYLQDYGILQNKEFSRVFPGVSEDSVLRDLKALIDSKIVVKRGSTKSSRYELK